MMKSAVQSRLTALRLVLLAVLMLASLAIAVRPSQAAVGDLAFTIEAPGVQVSQVQCTSGLTTETFDGVATNTYIALTQLIGNYAAFPQSQGFIIRVQPQDTFGGAEQPATPTNYVDSSGTYKLTLAQPAGYVGFWWSAGDGQNTLTVNMVDGSSQVFTTQSILDSGALQGTPGAGLDGHFGNPTQAFLGQASNEVFAYVNIFAANDNAKIESLVFSSAEEKGFETDNHTVCPDILDSTTGTPIPQPGSITIIKEANPESEQEFPFISGIDGASTFTLKDNGSDPNSITFDDLQPQGYFVGEQVPAGWTLEPIQCTGGANITISSSTSVAINLAAGEDVICTFTNTQKAVNLTIVKNAVGGDDTFEFEKGLNSQVDFADFSLTTQGGTAQTTLSNLPSDFIEISEVENPAWELTDVDCEGVTDGAWTTDRFDRLRITPTPGDDITCTFTNVAEEQLTDHILIVKRTVPAGGTDFGFTLSFGQTDLPFTLSDLEAQVIEVQPDVIYQVTEDDPGPDYALTDIECITTGPVPNLDLTIDRDNRRVEVEFEEGGASVLCIFTNEKSVNLTIVKNAVGGDDTFEFEKGLNSEVDFADFPLTTQGGTAQTTLSNLPSDFIEISEVENPAWDLTDVECEGVTDGAWTTDRFDRLRITPTPGDDITCTFTNEKLGPGGPGGPGVQPIPALSSWGLALLTLLMPMLAMPWLRLR